MNYKDAQLAVFHYLVQRHEQDSAFRFSLRNNFATDGSSGLFIGTIGKDSTPPYFCFTQWYIPLTFQGAAGDLLDYAVEWNRDQQSVRLVLQYLIAKTATGPQNAGSLALQDALREQLPAIPWHTDKPEHRLARLRYVAHDNIMTIDALVAELATLLDQTAPGVDAAIAEVKQQHPAWEAGSYSPAHFGQMLARARYKKADWLGGPPAYYCVGSSWENDQLSRFQQEGVWQNGKDAKFENTVNQVPVGARLAVKSAFPYEGKSMLRVKAYGTVTANLQDGENLVVAWDEAINSFDLPGLGKFRSTIHRLTNPQEIDLIFTPPAPVEPVDPPMPPVPYALNTILYGPPGTGKTYGTIGLAAHIATGYKPVNHAAAKRVFDELQGTQIEFVTFHQNYAYEDFMLGIRPSLSGENLGFQRQEGVFFKICQRATENYLARPTDTPTTFYRPFQEVFDEFIQPLVEADENGQSGEVTVSMKSGKSFALIGMTDSVLQFRKASGDTSHTLTIQKLEAAYNARSYSAVGLTLNSYYEPLVEALLEYGEAQRPTEPLKNYVLVIDEINRANISRVFGELITLLEDDKRLGGDNALTVRLPGGEEFAVPPNLYLLGTMNTADKSIALVDVALRRRFEFLGRYPDYDILDAAVRPVVQKLNDQIYEAKKSADFFIGHAYFLGKTAADLPDVLNKKVVPLLLEYFSGRTDFVEQQLKASLVATGLKVKRNEAYQLEVSAL